MGTGIEPTNDFAFKYVFGTEERIDVLAFLLNAVITDSGGVPMHHVQLLNPFSVKEGADDRVGILDIRARDDLERESLVEMQMLAHVSVGERLLWSTAKHYDQQLEAGDDYSELRPVMMVCFLNDTLFDDKSGQYHWCFRLIDENSGRQLTDQFVIHIVELSKFKKTLDELVSALDRWTYFLKHGSKLDLHHLPAQLQDCEGLTKAVEGLVMLSLDQQKRDDYTRRRLWEMDQRAYIQGAHQKGELKGVLSALVRIGTRKLGAPPPDVLAQLSAVKTVMELEALTDRVQEITSWGELLPIQP